MSDNRLDWLFVCLLLSYLLVFAATLTGLFVWLRWIGEWIR